MENYNVKSALIYDCDENISLRTAIDYIRRLLTVSLWFIFTVRKVFVKKVHEWPRISGEIVRIMVAPLTSLVFMSKKDFFPKNRVKFLQKNTFFRKSLYFHKKIVGLSTSCAISPRRLVSWKLPEGILAKSGKCSSVIGLIKPTRLCGTGGRLVDINELNLMG